MKPKEISDKLGEIGYTDKEIDYFFKNTPRADQYRALGRAELTQAANYLAIGALSAGLATSFVLKTGCDLNNLDVMEVTQAGLITGAGTLGVGSFIQSYKHGKSGLEKMLFKNYS